MKRTLFALLFFVTVFTVVANAQRFGSTTCGLMPGPCMERAARQALAPVDYYLNNGYGYGYGGYGYGNGRGMLVSATTGAIAGGLVAYVATRGSNRTTYAVAPDGGQYYAESQRRQVVLAASKSQKPLDCRKPAGKRGHNEAACTMAEQEAAARQQTAERQACLDQLANSPWRLRNFSPVATIHLTIGGQPLMVCGEQVILRPLQTIRIFPPDGQVGGFFFFAHSSGEKMRAEAEVQAVNRTGFTGFVLTIPGPPERSN